jgi:pseudaminic acid cytidylyltransferase
VRVAIIPARGGSRRIPRKNIRPFHGKPIIAYSIEAAKASGLFERIVVSTEDHEIGGIAEACGAQWIERDEELAVDAVGTQEVAARVLRDIMLAEPKHIGYACCIYATAPMMRASDITEMYEWLRESRLNYTYIEGWLYWGPSAHFLEDVPLDSFVGLTRPEGRWIDINTEEDWKRAEEMYAALKASADSPTPHRSPRRFQPTSEGMDPR